jgi:FixJ family two-component response regulator
MAKTTVYVVSDENEQMDKVKNTLAATGVTVTSYNSAQ